MKIDIATTKTIAKFVVGTSVKAVVTTAIVNLVPTENRVQKAQLSIGGYVIGSMVADQARTFTDAKIDKIVDSVNEIKTQIDKTKDQ